MSSFESLGDLVDWRIDVMDNGFDQVRTMNGARSFRVRDPDATLMLYRVTMEEAQDVIALVNKLRSISRSVPEPKPPELLSRFAGLEL
jgi:hypothetical protein